MPLYAFKNNAPAIHPSVFIAPDAHIIGNVTVAEKSSVWFQSVLRGDFDAIRIGARTNIQDLCVCHADENIPLTIGNGVTIGHRCIVHGCSIEDGCLIGMGAVIMNHSVIGEGSIVAAGSVVQEHTIIPPFSLVAGFPGKVKKTYKNTDKIKQKIKTMSGDYMKMADCYKSERLFYKLSAAPYRK